MFIVARWADVIVASLQRLWDGVISFIPNLVGAVVVFVIGLVVASGLSALVERLLSALHFDDLFSQLGLSSYFKRAGVPLKASFFVGRVVFWFIILVFLLAVSDALNLFGLTRFLTDVIDFVPNVIAASLILLASFVLGHFLRRVVSASVFSAKLHAADFLGTVSWWAVVIFGFFAALSQLHVAETIVHMLVLGFISMLALAGGLAFGLGGRDYAAHLLKKLQERTEGR